MDVSVFISHFIFCCMKTPDHHAEISIWENFGVTPRMAETERNIYAAASPEKLHRRTVQQTTGTTQLVLYKPRLPRQARPVVDVLKRWQATLSHKSEWSPFVYCIRQCIGRISCSRIHVVCALLQSFISVASCGVLYLIHFNWLSLVGPQLLCNRIFLWRHLCYFVFTTVLCIWFFLSHDWVRSRSSCLVIIRLIA